MNTIELLLFTSGYTMVGAKATLRLETVNHQFEHFQRYYGVARFAGELKEELLHKYFG
jgi:hypothetical protein